MEYEELFAEKAPADLTSKLRLWPDIVEIET